MADKSGDFSGAFGILIIILILVVMFTLAGGYRDRPVVQEEVSPVTQQIPASGNLVPQADTQPPASDEMAPPVTSQP